LWSLLCLQVVIMLVMVICFLACILFLLLWCHMSCLWTSNVSVSLDHLFIYMLQHLAIVLHSKEF
jgi:hypothetical protein